MTLNAIACCHCHNSNRMSTRRRLGETVNYVRSTYHLALLLGQFPGTRCYMFLCDTVGDRDRLLDRMKAALVEGCQQR